jgi:hypothetical protein
MAAIYSEGASSRHLTLGPAIPHRVVRARHAVTVDLRFTDGQRARDPWHDREAIRPDAFTDATVVCPPGCQNAAEHVEGHWEAIHQLALIPPLVVPLDGGGSAELLRGRVEGWVNRDGTPRPPEVALTLEPPEPEYGICAIFATGDPCRVAQTGTRRTRPRQRATTGSRRKRGIPAASAVDQGAKQVTQSDPVTHLWWAHPARMVEERIRCYASLPLWLSRRVTKAALLDSKPCI